MAAQEPAADSGLVGVPPGALLASAARSAAISGGTALVTQLSVQAHERFIDLDPEVNWRELRNSAAVSGASAFVSSAVGGWLRPHMIRLFTELMTEFVVSSQAELDAWSARCRRSSDRAGARRRRAAVGPARPRR